MVVFKILAVNGYTYELVSGEEKKLEERESGALINRWLRVKPTVDFLCADIEGERVQLSQVVAWIELPDPEETDSTVP